jgi:hypothetical protein
MCWLVGQGSSPWLDVNQEVFDPKHICKKYGQGKHFSTNSVILIVGFKKKICNLQKKTPQQSTIPFFSAKVINGVFAEC